MGGKRGTTSQRFWPKVDKRGPDDCWLWTASGGSHGYGNLRVAGVTRTSHALAWELSNGPIPGGLFVLHRCDVRRCCNPAHLFLGTNAQNMQDAASKGRMHGNGLTGERHPNSRLTAEQVRDIKGAVAAGETQSAVARRIGVTVQQVNNIVRGKQWREVA